MTDMEYDYGRAIRADERKIEKLRRELRKAAIDKIIEAEPKPDDQCDPTTGERGS